MEMFCYFIQKGPEFRNFTYLKGIPFFLSVSQFSCGLFFLEWIPLRVFGNMSTDTSILYGFWDKLDRKRLKSANFQNLKIVICHPILMQLFAKSSS